MTRVQVITIMDLTVSVYYGGNKSPDCSSLLNRPSRGQARLTCPSLYISTKPGHPRYSDALGLSDESGVIAQRNLVHVLVRENSFLLSREV